MNPFVEGVLLVGAGILVLAYILVALFFMRAGLIGGLISMVMLYGGLTALAMWKGYWSDPLFQKWMGIGVALSLILVIVGSYATRRQRSGIAG